MSFEEILAHAGVPDKSFFQDRDVCRIFSKTKVTIFNWRKAGLLESILINGQNFITRASLKALCEKGSAK